MLNKMIGGEVVTGVRVEIGRVPQMEDWSAVVKVWAGVSGALISKNLGMFDTMVDAAVGAEKALGEMYDGS